MANKAKLMVFVLFIYIYFRMKISLRGTITAEGDGTIPMPIQKLLFPVSIAVLFLLKAVFVQKSGTFIPVPAHESKVGAGVSVLFISGLFPKTYWSVSSAIRKTILGAMVVVSGNRFCSILFGVLEKNSITISIKEKQQLTGFSIQKSDCSK
jgi:hypothetical protein